MFKPITEKTLLELSKLHDKIKNHQFRKSPEKWLLDEYFDLYNKDLLDIIGRYTYDDDDYKLTNKGVYLYYRYIRDRWLHYKDSSFKDGYFHFNDNAEIWANPNIALINEAYHDLRGIKWSLKSNWDDNFYRKKYLGKFIETTEKILTVLHALIEGVEITEMSYPKEHREGQTLYKFVRNPLYDNDWTLEKYLHREWWEDKGYTDIEGDITYTNEIIK
jgi:hypothetical protein